MKETCKPQNSTEIFEEIHGVNWTSTKIPSLAELVGPIGHLLEVTYDKAKGSRMKRSIDKFILSTLGWNIIHTKAFQDFQRQI